MVTTGILPLQGKIPMVEPGMEPGTSWLVVRTSDHQTTRLVKEDIKDTFHGIAPQATEFLILFTACIFLQHGVLDRMTFEFKWSLLIDTQKPDTISKLN